MISSHRLSPMPIFLRLKRDDLTTIKSKKLLVSGNGATLWFSCNFRMIINFSNLHLPVIRTVNTNEEHSESENDIEVVDEDIADPIDTIETGEKANKEETLTSARIAFILFVLVVCILCVHYLIAKKLHHVPESVSVVFIGKFILS